MRNFMILSDALCFIEENICEVITQEDIAKACYCSVSSLQKLFRYAIHFTVKEYIDKRRLTCAARDIAKSELSITDIAMKYQYNSPEVFSRAFARLWNVKPSTFRKKRRFSGLFPRIVDFDYIGKDERGIIMRRKVDISEIYDVLKELTGTYVLCIDIVSMLAINKISHELGDKAILETAERLESISDDNMLIFRIGGDEFAVVTCLDDIEKVRVIAKDITAMNGKVVKVKEFESPLSLRVGAMRMSNTNIKYNELYSDMQQAINLARQNDASVFIME